MKSTEITGAYLNKVRSEALRSEDIASVFRIVDSPSRIGILRALINGPLSVTDIAVAINQSHSATSHQISILYRKGIIMEKASENRRVHMYRLGRTDETKAIIKIIHVVLKLYE
jgi:DNA-binding transcriptional ArsR family regulator